jgi:hypothetical protein
MSCWNSGCTKLHVLYGVVYENEKLDCDQCDELLLATKGVCAVTLALKV